MGEIEKIKSEIFLLEIQKRRYESLALYKNVEACSSIINHLIELIAYKEANHEE